MMAAALSVAVVVAATGHVPYVVPSVEEEKQRGRHDQRKISNLAVACQGRGDSFCDRIMKLNENDVISEKFMRDHICLIRGKRIEDVRDWCAFCRDFRGKGQTPPPPPKYQVMLLTPRKLKQLREDLEKHQGDYSDHQRQNNRIYTTEDRYNFVYCEQRNSYWRGYIKYGLYQQYNTQKSQDLHRIYHGRPPVKHNPGFET